MENLKGKIGTSVGWRVRMDKIRAEARTNVEEVLRRTFGYLKTSKSPEELEAELYEELSGG